MAKDLTVVLQDRPGELARLGQATGEAGVNIQGMCAFTGEGGGSSTSWSTTRRRPWPGRRWRTRAWASPTSARCWWSTSRIGRARSASSPARLARPSVNIELAYTTFGGVKLVIATDDIDSARAALD